MNKVFEFLVYQPVKSLLLLLAVLIPILLQIPNMVLDASSDTLSIDGDGDLEFYLKTQETFGTTNEQLIISYTTEDGVLDPEHIAYITALRDELLKLDAVETVTTIVDVPLFQSPPLNIMELANIKVTIENGRAGKTIEQIKEEMDGNN